MNLGRLNWGVGDGVLGYMLGVVGGILWLIFVAYTTALASVLASRFNIRR